MVTVADCDYLTMVNGDQDTMGYNMGKTLDAMVRDDQMMDHTGLYGLIIMVIGSQSLIEFTYNIHL